MSATAPAKAPSLPTRIWAWIEAHPHLVTAVFALAPLGFMLRDLSYDWLTANPRIKVHFTPTSGSWLNLVEVWFGIIERQAIHRGTFGCVKDSTRRSAPSSTAGTTAATPDLHRLRRFLGFCRC